MNFKNFAIVPFALAFTACETMNTPVSSSSFDPLKPPGSGIRQTSATFGPELSPGQFVTANIANTAFYKNSPKGSEDADKLLDYGTQMKIISLDSNHVKVELDSGEVGYVPAVMVTTPDTTTTPEVLPLDGAYQVYPPLPGGGPMEPLPIIDPGGLPPDGSIPAIIDPNAPVPEPTDAPTLDPIPEMIEPAEPLDPVAEAVRKKIADAMAEEEALKVKEALKETEDTPGEKAEADSTE